ncbi:MAG TPA: glycosyltransferase family 87 protein [Candidatus Sulfotelmatobacter sp.]|nr:glycosyltransferase family 87 protein [Candidatus Sulfotelmatobacter sp.]
MKKIYKYFFILLFLISFLLMAKVIFNNGYPDFSNFYQGPLVYSRGLNPYIFNINLFTPTTYPPVIFWLFSILNFLSYTTASKIWTILSISSLILSLILIFKFYTKKLFSSENLFLSSLVFFAFPIKFTLGMGQINIFILLLLTLFLYFLEKSKFKSSLFLGISLLLKLFPLFIIVYLILKRQLKILVITLMVVLIGVLITFFLIKPEINLYFFQKVLPTLVDSWKGDYYNQSLSGLIVRANINPDIRNLVRDILSLLILTPSLLIVILNKNKDKYAQHLEVGIIITVSLLLNSFSWQHHFVWLTIPFLGTYFFIKRNSNNKKALMTVLFCAYLLISLNLKTPQSFPIILQSHVFSGTLILLLLELNLINTQEKIINKQLSGKPKNIS